jgi:predicted aldo/keto reductase-like oxidoreductase
MKKPGSGLMRLPLMNPNDYSSIDTGTLNQMVNAFLERGFAYFDTAYVYHMGKSE